jgi:hypothetical protein
MDKIEDFQKKKNIKEVIKTAANNAMEKLKKYYKHTDALVYTVSTGISFFIIYVNYILFTLSYSFIFS